MGMSRMLQPKSKRPLKALRSESKKSQNNQTADDDLPDLKDKEVADATLKIQTVFRGFQARKKIVAKKKQQSEDLPDLNDKEVADASLKIQTVFRGFQARKKIAAKKKQ